MVKMKIKNERTPYDQTSRMNRAACHFICLKQSNFFHYQDRPYGVAFGCGESQSEDSSLGVETRDKPGHGETKVGENSPIHSTIQHQFSLVFNI